MSKAQVQKLDLCYLNLPTEKALYQLDIAELIEEALRNREGILADTGALSVDTGKFTGRSPKDRFIVCDDMTRDSVCWGDVNIPFDPAKFEPLVKKLTLHISRKKYYVRDSYVCADEAYKMTIRSVTDTAYQNMFVTNLFMRPAANELGNVPEWTILASPTFFADPLIDGTRQANFCVLNFNRKMILVGGTGYTGELKKGIFSVLNLILPLQRKVLSMHCSANIGEAGDTAIFFGLSGTGKTTLSADPDRCLVGDDEHGWGTNSVFNFEGGCYAKCANLTADGEPQIFRAVKFGALLENINYYTGTRSVDYKNIHKTENTRVAYPITYIENAVIPAVGAPPKNIFFLTADAFGVMPPISKLDAGQAMLHFLSGYTAKIAGTEAGVSAPQATFSACFGKAFLPLNPVVYAELLGERLKSNKVNVWLINTGWIGGAYGTGRRIHLSFTRAMVSAALKGELDTAEFICDPIFGLRMPLHCANVPSEILNPRNTWDDKQEYDRKAYQLSQAFIDNFKQFEDFANDEIRAALPKVG